MYKGLLPKQLHGQVLRRIEQLKKERMEQEAREKMEEDLYIDMMEDKGVS